MKLFTALYDDSRILKHFLDHYGAAGVSDFYIAVSPGLASAVAAFMPDFNIEVFEGLNVADSFCCGVSAVTEMRKQRQGKCERVRLEREELRVGGYCRSGRVHRISG